MCLGHYKKGKLQTDFTHKCICKKLEKISQKPNKHYIKQNSMYYDQAEFILRMQGYFNQYQLSNLHCKE